MTALAQVYTDIMNKVVSILSGGVRVFNTVAVYNDQITRMKNGSGTTYWLPAVFIELRTYNENTIGDQLTNADIDVIFHVAHMELDSGIGTLDQNLNIFTMRDYVKSTFSMFKPTNCGLFVWKGEQQQFNHDNINEYKLTYKCHYIDNVANSLITGTQYEYANAGITFSFGYSQSVG